MGRGLKIPWIGSPNTCTIGRGSIYHGYDGPHTIGRGVKIP